MFILKRFFFIINFLVCFFLLEWLIKNIKVLILPLGVFFLFFIIFSVWFLCFQITSLKKNLFLLISPFLLFFGIISSLLIIEAWWLKQALIVLFSLILSYYYKILLTDLRGLIKYAPGFLGNLTFYVNIFSFFLLTFSLYSFYILLDILIYYLLLVLLFIFLISGVAIFCLNKISTKSRWHIIIIGSLIAGEFFLVVSFLPVSYYISGLVLTLFFFIYYGIFRLHLLSRLNGRAVTCYLVLTLAGLVLVLFTARWF